jgi:hypothetical protein
MKYETSDKKHFISYYNQFNWLKLKDVCHFIILWFWFLVGNDNFILKSHYAILIVFTQGVIILYGN